MYFRFLLSLFSLTVFPCFVQRALFADEKTALSKKNASCQRMLNSQEPTRALGSKKNPYILSHEIKRCPILHYRYKGEGQYKHFRIHGLKAKQLYRFKMGARGPAGSIRLKTFPEISSLGLFAKKFKMNLKGDFNISFYASKQRAFEFEILVKEGAECIFQLEAASPKEQAAIEKRKKERRLAREKRREELAKKRAERSKRLKRRREERLERFEKRRLEQRKRRQYHKIDQI